MDILKSYAEIDSFNQNALPKIIAEFCEGNTVNISEVRYDTDGPSCMVTSLLDEKTELSIEFLAHNRSGNINALFRHLKGGRYRVIYPEYNWSSERITHIKRGISNYLRTGEIPSD